jgi:hypothetical protein
MSIRRVCLRLEKAADASGEVDSFRAKMGTGSNAGQNFLFDSSHSDTKAKRLSRFGMACRSKAGNACA